jgi:hypothetical protein
MKAFLRSISGLLFIQYVNAFFPRNQRLSLGKNTANQVSATSKPSVSEENIFTSRLVPPVTDEEFDEMFKEFNVTALEYRNKDPELEKWRPSKDLFEKYGVKMLNQTLQNPRTLMDVKTKFYDKYTVPLLPQYKTFIADFMAINHYQTIDTRFVYDTLFAFGICTQYYTIMKGYALQEEVSITYNFKL